MTCPLSSCFCPELCKEFQTLPGPLPPLIVQAIAEDSALSARPPPSQVAGGTRLPAALISASASITSPSTASVGVTAFTASSSLSATPVHSLVVDQDIEARIRAIDADAPSEKDTLPAVRLTLDCLPSDLAHRAWRAILGGYGLSEELAQSIAITMRELKRKDALYPGITPEERKRTNEQFDAWNLADLVAFLVPELAAMPAPLPPLLQRAQREMLRDEENSRQDLICCFFVVFLAGFDMRILFHFGLCDPGPPGLGGNPSRFRRQYASCDPGSRELGGNRICGWIPIGWYQPRLCRARWQPPLLLWLQPLVLVPLHQVLFPTHLLCMRTRY